MGREIVYCFKCQRRILGDELDKGSAYQVGNRITCSSCAVHLLETLPPREKEKLLAKMFRETKDRQASPANSAAPPARKWPASSPELQSIAGPPRQAGRRVGLLVGVAVGVGAAVVAVLAFGGSPAPVKEPRAAGAVAPSPGERRRQDAADAIRKARDFSQAHASDVDGLVALWQDAVFASDGTPYLADSKREHEAALTRQREAVGKELADLDQRVAAFLDKEEYKAAQDAIDAARSRRAAPDWTLGVAQKAAATAQAVTKSFAKVMEQAAAAKRGGDEHAAAEFRAKVARWGLPKYASDLDQGLAAVALPKPLADAALVGYWPLDEGSGATALDASGNGHAATLAGAAWVAGKFGWGLRFDGARSVLEIPCSPDLDRLQERDYTVAAWVKVEGIPTSGTESYGIVVKPGYHTGLSFDLLGRFHMGHWFEGKDRTYLQANGAHHEPGTFHHVAGVVDWTAGATRVYVDGVLENTSGWPKSKLPSVDIAGSPWRVGCALPGADQYRLAAKGVIDEVRLYSRALGDSDIRVLYGARPDARRPAGSK